MKQRKQFSGLTYTLISCVALFCYGCKKSPLVTKTTTMTSIYPQIVYSMDDTLGNTTTALWSITEDGITNKKIPISLPANLHFEFDDDIAAEISTNNETMALSPEDTSETVYFYTCNIDGSNVQPIPQLGGYLYLQSFINPTSILYWKFTGSVQDENQNGELWQANTDGSANQQINISLPAGISFGDGKFVKITSDAKTIVFSTSSSNVSPIYKCNIDGTDLTAITAGNASTILEALANNNTILYLVYGQTDNLDQLWTVNIDGTNNHQVSLALPAGLTLADSRIQASSTSMYFVTTSQNDTQAIYSANLDGSNIKLIENIPLGYAVKLQGLIE